MHTRYTQRLLGALLLVLPALANAQVATYSFTGNLRTATTTNANAVATALQVGPGITGSFATSGSPSPPSFETTGYGAAFDADDYVEITLTARVGFTLNLTGVTLNISRENNGPGSFQLRTSLDGFASRVGPVQTREEAIGFQSRTFNLANATGITNTPTVTLRIYGYDAAGAGRYVRFDEIEVAGTVPAEGGSTTVVQEIQNGAGYRLLGAPVDAFTVGDLAALNLVQGVTGQYPDAAPNVFVGYTNAGYTAATRVGQTLQPGRGFFWQLYDRRITPNPTSFGGGTSESYPVPRTVSAVGVAQTANVVQTLPLNTAGFYMIANPFARALQGTGVTQTAGGGTFSTFLQAYDPSMGYQPIERTAATRIATWQGVFAEVQDATGPVTFAFLAAQRTVADPAVVSRAAQSGVAQSGVALALDGTTAAGDVTHDGAAIVRFAGDAEAGWDAGDTSKLVPPTQTYALLAPAGTRGDAAVRQAVLSLPTLASETVRVPLAFTATAAGTYTVSAADLAGVPADAAVTLADVATGARTDLRAVPTYTFESEATDWTERFVLTVAPARATAADDAAPAAAELSAPRPNPATGRAALSLRLAAPEAVTATLVDALGRTVATLFEGTAGAGADLVLTVDASGLAPGVYAVRVQGETFAETRRLTVVR